MHYQTQFGMDVSDDEPLTPSSKNASQRRRTPLDASTDELAALAGLDVSRVALEMDKLNTEVTNDRLDNMLRALEGYEEVLSSSSSSKTPNARRLRRNTANSSEAGSTFDNESNPERAIPNPRPPLHSFQGFGEIARPVESNHQSFLDDLLTLAPVDIPSNLATTGGQNSHTQYTPSRYAANHSQTYNNETDNGEKRRRPWQKNGQENGPQVNVSDYNQFVPGQHQNSILYDAEKISMERAVSQLNSLKRMHKHWETKLLRPSAAGAPEVSINNGKKFIQKTAYAAFLLLVELVRTVNFDHAVSSGLLASHPNALPTDPPPSTAARIMSNTAMEVQSSQQSADANDDAAMLMNNNEPISVAAIEAAVLVHKKKLYSIWSELINRSPDAFGQENKQLANKYWSELATWLDKCLILVASFYNIRFLDSNILSRSVMEMSSMEMECIQKDERLKFKIFLSRKMASLNFRRGPKAGYIYHQHFVDGVTPSNFWVRSRPLRDFLLDLVSPINGPEVMPLHAYAEGKIDSIAAMILDGDKSLFPVVSPLRGLYGFRNGLLDVIENRFYAFGSKAYLDNVQNAAEEKYVYNYFDDNYNSEGYSATDGTFDWRERMAPFDPDGKPDWSDPERLPAKHWARVLTVPILDDNIRVQKWDLHTIQNLWFSFGRLCHTIEDNLQFAPFLKGNPGTGKSTFLQFAILLIPAEFRAIIPANAEAVFGLQQLVGKEDKFVKHLGVVSDMNGKFTIPTSQLNSLVTGEFFTTADKHHDTKSAKADMPMAFAGNQFFDDKAIEMPSKIRRFWQFILNNPPSVSNQMVNSESIVKAIPAYLRMITEVYHEFWRHKQLSPSDQYRYSTNPWDFASPYLKSIRMETMVNVSGAAKFLAATDWIYYSGSTDDFLSLDSLRYACDIYFAYNTGLRTDVALATRKSMIPSLITVFDGISLIHSSKVMIEDWGHISCKTRFGDDSPLATEGLPCQLGDTIRTVGQKYAVGLKICPERLEMLKQYMPKEMTAGSAPQPQTFAVPQPISNNTNIFANAKPSRPQQGAPHRPAARNPAPPAPVVSNAELTDLSHLFMDMDDPDV